LKSQTQTTTCEVNRN